MLNGSLDYAAVRSLVIAVLLGLAIQTVWVLTLYGLAPLVYGPAYGPIFKSDYTTEQLWVYTALDPLSENICGGIIFYSLLWKDWRPSPGWHAVIFVCLSVVIAFFAHTR